MSKKRKTIKEELKKRQSRLRELDVIDRRVVMLSNQLPFGNRPQITRDLGRHFLGEVIPDLAIDWDMPVEKVLNKFANRFFQEAEEKIKEEGAGIIQIDDIFGWGRFYEGALLVTEAPDWEIQTKETIPETDYVTQWDLRNMVNDPYQHAFILGQQVLFMLHAEENQASEKSNEDIISSESKLPSFIFDDFDSSQTEQNLSTAKPLPEDYLKTVPQNIYEDLARLVKKTVSSKFHHLIDQWLLTERDKLLRCAGTIIFRKHYDSLESHIGFFKTDNSIYRTRQRQKK